VFFTLTVFHLSNFMVEDGSNNIKLFDRVPANSHLYETIELLTSPGYDYDGDGIPNQDDNHPLKKACPNSCPKTAVEPDHCPGNEAMTNAAKALETQILENEKQLQESVDKIAEKLDATAAPATTGTSKAVHSYRAPPADFLNKIVFQKHNEGGNQMLAYMTPRPDAGENAAIKAGDSVDLKLRFMSTADQTTLMDEDYVCFYGLDQVIRTDTNQRGENWLECCGHGQTDGYYDFEPEPAEGEDPIISCDKGDSNAFIWLPVGDQKDLCLQVKGESQINVQQQLCVTSKLSDQEVDSFFDVGVYIKRKDPTPSSSQGTELGNAGARTGRSVPTVDLNRDYISISDPQFMQSSLAIRPLNSQIGPLCDGKVDPCVSISEASHLSTPEDDPEEFCIEVAAGFSRDIPEQTLLNFIWSRKAGSSFEMNSLLMDSGSNAGEIYIKESSDKKATKDGAGGEDQVNLGARLAADADFYACIAVPEGARDGTEDNCRAALVPSAARAEVVELDDNPRRFGAQEPYTYLAGDLTGTSPDHDVDWRGDIATATREHIQFSFMVNTDGVDDDNQEKTDPMIRTEDGLQYFKLCGFKTPVDSAIWKNEVLQSTFRWQIRYNMLHKEQIGSLEYINPTAPFGSNVVHYGGFANADNTRIANIRAKQYIDTFTASSVGESRCEIDTASPEIATRQKAYIQTSDLTDTYPSLSTLGKLGPYFVAVPSTKSDCSQRKATYNSVGTTPLTDGQSTGCSACREFQFPLDLGTSADARIAAGSVIALDLDAEMSSGYYGTCNALGRRIEALKDEEGEWTVDPFSAIPATATDEGSLFEKTTTNKGTIDEGDSVVCTKNCVACGAQSNIEYRISDVRSTVITGKWKFRLQGLNDDDTPVAYSGSDSVTCEFREITDVNNQGKDNPQTNWVGQHHADSNDKGREYLLSKDSCTFGEGNPVDGIGANTLRCLKTTKLAEDDVFRVSQTIRGESQGLDPRVNGELFCVSKKENIDGDDNRFEFTIRKIADPSYLKHSDYTKFKCSDIDGGLDDQDATVENNDLTYVTTGSTNTDGYFEWSGTGDDHITFSPLEHGELDYPVYEIIKQPEFGFYQVNTDGTVNTPMKLGEKMDVYPIPELTPAATTSIRCKIENHATQLITESQPTAVDGGNWVQNEIVRFVSAKVPWAMTDLQDDNDPGNDVNLPNVDYCIKTVAGTTLTLGEVEADGSCGAEIAWNTIGQNNNPVNIDYDVGWQIERVAGRVAATATDNLFTTLRAHNLEDNDVVRFTLGTPYNTDAYTTPDAGFDLGTTDYCVKIPQTGVTTTFQIYPKYGKEPCDDTNDVVPVTADVDNTILRLSKRTGMTKFTMKKFGMAGNTVYPSGTEEVDGETVSTSLPINFGDDVNTYNVEDATFTHSLSGNPAPMDNDLIEEIDDDNGNLIANPNYFPWYADGTAPPESENAIIENGATRVTKMSGEILMNLADWNDRGLWYYDREKKKALFTTIDEIVPQDPKKVVWLCGTFKPSEVTASVRQVRIVNQTVASSDGSVVKLGSVTHVTKGNRDTGCINLNTRKDSDFVCASGSRRRRETTELMAIPSTGRKLLTSATTTSASSGQIHGSVRNQCSHCHTDDSIGSLQSESTNFKRTGDAATDDKCINAIVAHEHMGKPCSRTPEYTSDLQNKYHLTQEICHVVYCCHVKSGQVKDDNSICAEDVIFDVPYTGKEE